MKFLTSPARQTTLHHAPAAEISGTLTPTQLQILHEADYFNLFVPKTLGGLGLPLSEGLEIEEALAETDGSLGWTVTLCAGAAWFAGFLDPALAKEVFSTPGVCLGGSGAATGMAVQTDNGYQISGNWRYATGAPHLTHFTANCQLADASGNILLNPDGTPQISAFIFKRSEVEILPDWRAMGLVATASHSFRVADLLVGPERAFAIDPAAATLPDPIFQYPFLPFAAATIAVNFLGMTRRFMALAAEVLQAKGAAQALQLQQENHKRILTTRQALYRIVAASWENTTGSTAPDASLFETVNHQSAALADQCIRTVDGIFPYCGMAGADTTTELNRVWRDLHTASQHGLLRQLL